MLLSPHGIVSKFVCMTFVFIFQSSSFPRIEGQPSVQTLTQLLHFNSESKLFRLPILIFLLFRFVFQFFAKQTFIY